MEISLIGEVQHMNKDKIKLIIDTDVGDDIDDSFAILLAHESHVFDILGVTTVFRNSLKRAKMAKQIISSLGYETKVYAGCDVPFISKIDDLIQPEIRAKEKVDEFGLYLIPQWDESMENERVEEMHAVDFIIEQIHKYPNEVVLTPIGPLTNIAMAMRKDPTIIPLIKEVRLMGGGYQQDWAEWNVFCDPEAASIVFNSGAKVTMVGFNVTIQTALSPEKVEIIRNSKSKALQIISKGMERWFKHYEFTTPVMHDPLVIASLIDEEILNFIDIKMDVDLKEVRGKTFVKDISNSFSHKVAVSVNKDRFFEIFKFNLNI